MLGILRPHSKAMKANQIIAICCLFILEIPGVLATEATQSSQGEQASKSGTVQEADLRTLNSWIDQLNVSGRAIFDSQKSREEKSTNIEMSNRLVKGIDQLLDKWEKLDASEHESKMIIAALKRMNATALGLYQQTPSRYRKYRQVIEKAYPHKHSNQAINEHPIVRVNDSPQDQPKSEVHAYAYSETQMHKLQTEDLDFGEEQVRLMVQDRPAMAKYVAKGDPIWNWCVRQFAGEYTGVRYYWKAFSGPYLIGNPLASHTPPYKGVSGWITVADAKGKSKAGELQWAGAIFELFNMRNDPAFLAWERHKAVGKMSSGELTLRNSQLEYEALKQRSRFFRDAWKSHAKATHVEPTGKFWGEDLPATYKEWIAKFPKDYWYLRCYE